jgi:Zn-dependent protease with chaperone function
MEYRPSLPENNVNVSHARPVREFILLFLGITVILLVAFWALGLFVDSAVNFISPGMESVIFQTHDVSAPLTANADGPKQAELQRLADALRKCDGISYPVKVHLVESDQANALAVPGGRIVVFSGLLDKVRSENGLAFVLAHELAHFKDRDHLRSMGRGIVLTAMMAVISGTGSQLTQLFAPAANLSQAHYSRERESMADRQALLALNCYYGHVGGASEFFKAVQPDATKKSLLNGHYFASHPEAVARIDNLHRLTRDLNLDVQEVRPLPTVLEE